MLYSEVLNNVGIQARLKDAGVDHIKSPALREGDFPSFPRLNEETILAIADNEIIARRKWAEIEKEMDELNKKNASSMKQQAKERFVKPHLEALIRGRFHGAYSTLEDAAINYYSEQAAKKYDFDPESGDVQSEDLSGLSELQRILKQASIVRLSAKLSIGEIAQRTFLDNEGHKFLK